MAKKTTAWIITNFYKDVTMPTCNKLHYTNEVTLNVQFQFKVAKLPLQSSANLKFLMEPGQLLAKHHHCHHVNMLILALNSNRCCALERYRAASLVVNS